jgi:PEP-CTERM motif
MTIGKHCLNASLAIGLWAMSMAGARATNVIFSPNADISLAPYVISLDGGAVTFTFTDINDTADTFIDAVSTGGNARVDSFVGFPAPFQQDILISDADAFSPFPFPTGILYSNGLVSVGLNFQLADGVHFGYATVFGPEVVQYGYNSTPGEPIGTGASAPEPATWVMLIIGLGTIGVFGRFGRRTQGDVMDGIGEAARRSA